jgi:hypothetical protein
MRRSNVGQANFKKFMSDLTPLGGKKLKGPDQAAMQAKERIFKRSMELSPRFTTCQQKPNPEIEHDWKAIGAMEKRRTLGGQTFKRGDGVCD